MRRDGTVVGDPTSARGDPLEATLAAARRCEAVHGVTICQAGRRSAFSGVQAAASVEDGAEPTVDDFERRVAEAPGRSVITPLFAIGLRASALRGRTADPVMRARLDEVVHALDDVIVGVRLAITGAPGAPGAPSAPSPPNDGNVPAAARELDLETHHRVIAELHAIGMSVELADGHTDDAIVHGQLRRIVEELANSVSGLQDALFDSPEAPRDDDGGDQATGALRT